MDKSKTGSTGRTGGEGGGLRKKPDEWKTGGEPMTTAQKSYLETLAREANEEVPGRGRGGVGGPARELTKAEAAKEIERLQRKTGRSKKSKRA